jgi:anti-anti-sigma factor
MTARAMPGVSAEKSARAGCVVVALRGELDVCTAAGGLSALTALAAAGARVIVDLAELAFMDCYSLGEIMAVRARARRAGGDLVLAAPQPVVLRLLVLCDVVSHELVFTSVDEAVSGAGSAPAALVMSGAAGGAASSLARSGIVPSALLAGGAAMRHARVLTGLITAAGRKRQVRATLAAHSEPGSVQTTRSLAASSPALKAATALADPAISHPSGRADDR